MNGKKESVHLESWVKAGENAIDKKLENEMEIVRKFIGAATVAREKRGIKRRWPVCRIVYSPNSETGKNAIDDLKDVAMSQANSLKLEILEPGERLTECTVVAKPNFSKLGPEFKWKAKKIAQVLSEMDGEDVKEKIEKGHPINVDGEKIVISQEHVNFKEILPENFEEADFEFGTVYLDCERTEEILAQGYAREAVRRLQEMRKEKDLDIEAFIKARVGVMDERIVRLLKKKKKYICRETRAKELEIGEEIPHKGFCKEWKIKNLKFTISITECK
jgi:isoleucyl-tRNA synthetase